MRLDIAVRDVRWHYFHFLIKMEEMPTVKGHLTVDCDPIHLAIWETTSLRSLYAMHFTDMNGTHLILK